MSTTAPIVCGIRKQFICNGDEIVYAVYVRADIVILEINLFDGTWDLGQIGAIDVDIRS